jgi:hypothetical protein
MKRCLVFLFVAFLVACPSRLLAADRTPVQAGLLRSLDAAHFKVGDSVLAKVSTRWQSSDCTLREGAILKGRVVAQVAHSKTSKISEIALLFDSGECGGSSLKPLPLTVAAVMAGDPRRDRGMYESQPLSEAVGSLCRAEREACHRRRQPSSTNPTDTREGRRCSQVK